MRLDRGARGANDAWQGTGLGSQQIDAVGFLESLFTPNGKGACPADGQPIPEPIITPADLPDEWREHYEERAAIREYDGRQAREYAEAEALRETMAVMKAADHRS